MYVFFFKQKTSYDMRISDWSSDVCSYVLDTDRAEDRRLLLAGDQEGEPAAALDRRVGHGDACFGSATGDGGDPELALVQHRLTRQQRGGVPVVAEPEQHDIEQRPCRIQRRGAVGPL